MRGPRFLREILVILMIGLLPSCAEARGKSATYDGAIDFGAQLLSLNDGCLSVEGTMTSGSFFKDLKRSDLGIEPEYKKDGKVVREYPEFLTTSIRIVGEQCAATLPNSVSSIFNGDSYTLTFEVEWKDGMELRPASLSPAVAHCVGYRVTTDLSRSSTIPAITCEMTVDSRGVSLGNHLIVSVFSADGTRLTRLSAAP
jgi:hypothetical protein